MFLLMYLRELIFLVAILLSQTVTILIGLTRDIQTKSVCLWVDTPHDGSGILSLSSFKSAYKGFVFVIMSMYI